MIGRKASVGKAAICPFCGHVHPTALHRRLAARDAGEDALLLGADLDPESGKGLPRAHIRRADRDPDRPRAPCWRSRPSDRDPSQCRTNAFQSATASVVHPSVYGAQTYGDLCNTRQTLGLVRLARIITELGIELAAKYRLSERYAAALTGYAASVFVRKIKKSTRGTTLSPHRRPNSNRIDINHIFTNEASLASPTTTSRLAWARSGDVGLARGRHRGRASQAGRALVRKTCPDNRGTALALSLRDGSTSAVITDPPYDEMIPYSDASDLFYVWLKRALITPSRGSPLPRTRMACRRSRTRQSSSVSGPRKRRKLDHRTA